MAGFPYLEEGDWFQFPNPETAGEEGIVAWGGNLSPGMLLSAYSQGLFPWFSAEDPILWWSPDPRFVIFPGEVHTPERMKRILRQGRFSFRLDASFHEVITACAEAPRPGQEGTWITGDMIEAYCRMHELGYAHCVEAWTDGKLAGGLYGISLGRIFFGESMFSRVSNAGKAAFLFLVEFLKKLDCELIDSQVRTGLLTSLGGRDIPRKEYFQHLQRLLEYDTVKNTWLTAVIMDGAI